MPTPARFVSVNLKPEARDALQAATGAMTTSGRRRLTLSEVLIAGLRVASRHRREWADELDSARRADQR